MRFRCEGCAGYGAADGLRSDSASSPTVEVGRAFPELRSLTAPSVGAARSIRGFGLAKRDLGELLEGVAPSDRSLFQYVRLTGIYRPILWHCFLHTETLRAARSPRVADACNKVVSDANKFRELRHTDASME